jgi:hypothetical protein
MKVPVFWDMTLYRILLGTGENKAGVGELMITHLKV